MGKSILINDDCIEMCESIAWIIEQIYPDAEIRMSTSFIDMEKIMFGFRPDLIITDYKTPHGTFSDFLHARGLPYQTNVIVTSINSADVDMSTLDKNRMHYICKMTTTKKWEIHVKRIFDSEMKSLLRIL